LGKEWRVLIVFGREKPVGTSKLVRPGWITLENRKRPYTLIRVRSRKRMTVLVTARGKIEVRVPIRVTIREAEEFLLQCSAWVLKRLAVVNKEFKSRPLLGEGAIIPLLGESLVLTFDSTPGQGIEDREGVLLVPQIWSGEEGQLQQRLELWFKSQARIHFRSRLTHWSHIMGVKYNRLAIRSQKTIWGSCSAKKNININWRLMWMPYGVADYVVIHELSHLDHMDHSPQFWARVEAFEPDFRSLRGQLRDVKTPW
jgi:predicted metal-dependent hydrolase